MTTSIKRFGRGMPRSWDVPIIITGADGVDYNLDVLVDDDGINLDSVATDTDDFDNHGNPVLPEDVWELLRSLKIAVSRTNTVTIATGK